MGEERWASFHEFPMLVSRRGRWLVGSLVLVLVLIHHRHHVGHALHKLGLHGHQLLHSHLRRVWWWWVVVVVVVRVTTYTAPCLSHLGYENDNV